MALNITLCLRHLAERVSKGWFMDTDRGMDSQPCYDCRVAETSLAGQPASN